MHQLWTQLSPASPYAPLLCIFIFIGLYKIVTCCKSTASVLDDEILHQSLEAFFKSLKAKTREAWLREEVTMRRDLDIEKLSEEGLIRLAKFKDDSKSNRPKLHGVHNYDMLANPFYADQFAYVPASFSNRSEYTISEYQNKEMRIKQLDVVRLVCDLAYVREEEAKKMEFSDEYLRDYEYRIRQHKSASNKTADI